MTFERTEAITLTIGGTATAGVDFTLVNEGGQALTAPYRIAFPPGVSSVTATIRVADDEDDEEPDEDISIGASLARRAASLGAVEIVVQASPNSRCSQPSPAELRIRRHQAPPVMKSRDAGPGATLATALSPLPHAPPTRNPQRRSLAVVPVAPARPIAHMEG